MKTSWLQASLAAACLVAAQAATAQTSSPLEIRALAATCANCHGTDGKAASGSAVGVLAGLKQDYLSQQLKAFKNGQRPATVMHQLAKGYTDEQLEQLSVYFANQR